MSWLQRMAGEAPVPVYVARGIDASHDDLAALALDANIELVATPRHAAVLLVVGTVPAKFHDGLRRLHDQMPRPATTLWYRSRPLPEFDAPHTLSKTDRLAPTLTDLYRTLYGRTPQPVLLPDRPPAPWRGLGDYGQGGEGMMGGTPYGRPMAMTDDDLRDGLQLDALGFTLGPFFGPWAPGLLMHMSLQGDVVQRVSVQSPPFPQAPPTVFGAALRGAVPIADLELARARSHLFGLAHSLETAGLRSLALRTLAHAARLRPGVDIGLMRGWLRRCGLFASVPPGCGQLTRTQAIRIGGTAARAAGQPMDARLEDPAYRRLGFSVIVQDAGDCRARWRQWLGEIEQSLALADRAAGENVYTAQTEVVETPRGRWRRGAGIADASAVLEELLPGMEWSEAMATIASLDVAAGEPGEGGEP